MHSCLSVSDHCPQSGGRFLSSDWDVGLFGQGANDNGNAIPQNEARTT
jgi:hypothetical protein